MRSKPFGQMFKHNYTIPAGIKKQQPEANLVTLRLTATVPAFAFPFKNQISDEQMQNREKIHAALC